MLYGYTMDLLFFYVLIYTLNCFLCSFHSVEDEKKKIFINRGKNIITLLIYQKINFDFVFLFLRQYHILVKANAQTFCFANQHIYFFANFLLPQLVKLSNDKVVCYIPACIQNIYYSKKLRYYCYASAV